MENLLPGFGESFSLSSGYYPQTNRGISGLPAESGTKPGQLSHTPLLGTRDWLIASALQPQITYPAKGSGYPPVPSLFKLNPGNWHQASLHRPSGRTPSIKEMLKVHKSAGNVHKKAGNGVISLGGPGSWSSLTQAQVEVGPSLIVRQQQQQQQRQQQQQQRHRVATRSFVELEGRGDFLERGELGAAPLTSGCGLDREGSWISQALEGLEKESSLPPSAGWKKRKKRDFRQTSPYIGTGDLTGLGPE
ncbi:unnamed protein product [Pleuronectes platessa]|uniref:Uncharacterized protein n=1 Tax=Pleuronectes platessa TaxID=8262 RepID=A0A9N7YN27_PLEPL|nr:unnamed protein product [Pleuronectes platessa]